MNPQEKSKHQYERIRRETFLSQFDIDKVIDVRRAASLKAGGIGVRYTCMVRGKQTYLFSDEDRWFMERK